MSSFVARLYKCNWNVEMAGLDSETKDDKMTKQLLRMWIPSKHFCQLHKEYKIIAAGVRTKDGLGHLKGVKKRRSSPATPKGGWKVQSPATDLKGSEGI